MSGVTSVTIYCNNNPGSKHNESSGRLLFFKTEFQGRLALFDPLRIRVLILSHNSSFAASPIILLEVGKLSLPSNKAKRSLSAANTTSSRGHGHPPNSVDR
jgi:hypothetical protein